MQAASIKKVIHTLACFACVFFVSNFGKINEYPARVILGFVMIKKILNKVLKMHPARAGIFGYKK